MPTIPVKAFTRSSYKNALRLARTEINMAYRTADNADRIKEAEQRGTLPYFLKDNKEF